MNTDTRDLHLESTITCPECEFQKTEIMPVDSCQVLYECQECNDGSSAQGTGDCCVFCSFGTTPCPPIQRARQPD